MRREPTQQAVACSELSAARSESYELTAGIGAGARSPELAATTLQVSRSSCTSGALLQDKRPERGTIFALDLSD
jgi:hypothetical protein